MASTNAEDDSNSANSFAGLGRRTTKNLPVDFPNFQPVCSPIFLMMQSPATSNHDAKIKLLKIRKDTGGHQRTVASSAVFSPTRIALESRASLQPNQNEWNRGNRQIRQNDDANRCGNSTKLALFRRDLPIWQEMSHPHCCGNFANSFTISKQEFDLKKAMTVWHGVRLCVKQ